jgi:hypothetical protein
LDLQFTFGMANAQWIFLNWGNQFINWKKTSLALFNWFMILGKSSMSTGCDIELIPS